MIQSNTSAGRRILTTVMALIAACAIVMSCSGTPAFAKTDPGWGGSGNYGQEERDEGPVSRNNEGNDTGSRNTDGGDSTTSETTGNDTGHSSDDSGDGSDDKNTVVAEQGFSTPGNGTLGDQIKSANGKDFYTVRTKNNNTFYLVIDHANSAENVYMLSLIDENDLAEFLEEDGDSKDDKKTAAPVIIPETKPQTENKTEDEPAAQTPGIGFSGTGTLLIILLVAGIGGLGYYFAIYRPRHEEEETDDSEGMEIDDGLPMENEDE